MQVVVEDKGPRAVLVVHRRCHLRKFWRRSTRQAPAVEITLTKPKVEDPHLGPTMQYYFEAGLPVRHDTFYR